MNLCAYTSNFPFSPPVRVQSFSVDARTNGRSFLQTSRPLFRARPEPGRSITWFTRHKSYLCAPCLGALKRNRLCTYDRVRRCQCDVRNCVRWKEGGQPKRDGKYRFLFHKVRSVKRNKVLVHAFTGAKCVCACLCV